MENENLQVFEYETSNVRVVYKDGNPWWVAKDVCDVFGETNYRRAIASIDSDEKGVSQVYTPGGNQNMTVVNESGLYSLLFSMQPSKARGVDAEYVSERENKLRKFKHWVTHDVLPDIRKHGLYATDAAIDKMLSDPNSMIIVLTKYKEEREKRQALEAEIEIQKPLVDFANHVSDTADLLTMSQMAKIAYDEHINIGRNKLFDWLRDRGYLRPNNEPYQEFIDRGYFKVKETRKDSSYGTQFYTQTFVTGRGQIYFIEKLRSEFGCKAS